MYAYSTIDEDGDKCKLALVILKKENAWDVLYVYYPTFMIQYDIEAVK
jgi:hypothetical protein